MKHSHCETFFFERIEMTTHVTAALNVTNERMNSRLPVAPSRQRFSNYRFIGRPISDRAIHCFRSAPETSLSPTYSPPFFHFLGGEATVGAPVPFRSSFRQLCRFATMTVANTTTVGKVARRRGRRKSGAGCIGWMSYN